ncbi:hypothetical protein GQ54DRAFT_207227 [Martensiomyces pterosporus]|nr:hypothetical protein GQ54DRAFT_207227 [Martensiomyces pterosporus]
MSLDPLSVPFLHSCERCRQKKRKCSGEKPACAWCRKHSIPCRYRRSMRFKKQLEAGPESSLSALTTPVQLGVPGALGTSSVQANGALANIYQSASPSGGRSVPIATTGNGAEPMSALASQPQHRLQQQQFPASHNRFTPPDAPGQLISSLPVAPAASSAPSSSTQMLSSTLAASIPSIVNNPMASMVAVGMAGATPERDSRSPSTSDGNLFSADALSRLLSVDMIPQTNPPPPNLLQVVNSYLTPLSGMGPLSAPEWMASSNTEASILANLGDLATSGLLNSPPPTIPLNFNEHLMGETTIGGFPQDFLNSEMMFPVGSDPLISSLKDPLLPLVPSSSSAALNASSSAEISFSNLGSATPQLPPQLPRCSASLTAPLLPTAGTTAQRTGTISAGIANPMPIGHSALVPQNASQGRQTLAGGISKHVASPVGYSQPCHDSIDVGDVSSGLLPTNLKQRQAQTQRAGTNEVASDSGAEMQQSTPVAGTKDNRTQLSKQSFHIKHGLSHSTATESQQHVAAASAGGVHASMHTNDAAAASTHVTEADVPPILKEYVSTIPGKPSAVAIYKIMRETFKAPRMGMVSLNLELLWYMLHKNVLPRIVFYGHISSTIRCSIANLDIKSMVPPNIDESCYELALDEIPLIKDCSAIWGAIGLCMITRYEFQSARYKEMTEHVNMALDIMYRIHYRGCSYPWHDVPAEHKETFGFQYLLAIFWKCFLWKMMAYMLIEQGMEFKCGLDHLPDYSSKTYDLYTVEKKYDVDLMEMIPEDSWFGADPSCKPSIRFCGPSDPEFMRLRPEGSPCFDRAATSSGPYYQQLLVVFSKFLVLKNRAKDGKIGLGQLLKSLWVYRERMRMWRYSLPPDLVLDAEKVAAYLDIIRPDSSASHRDIDLKASHLKDVIMLLLTYHTFLIRANRFVMKMMLGEQLNAPPPDVKTAAFGIRDLYDSKKPPKIVADDLGHMNMYFHGCRIQAIKSANSLCNIVQVAYSCKFNFYTLGSPIVFTIFELLVVYVSFLRNRDRNIVWISKSRLSNVFNILRMLRHWAPALHIFVAGIKALSEQSLCLEKPRDFNLFKRDMMDPEMLAMSDSPVDSASVSDEEDSTQPAGKRRRATRHVKPLESTKDARTNILTSTKPKGAPLPMEVRRDETLSYRAADPIPEFPNPYPPSHVISLIIKDLGLSLAEFLAPSYPILLLRLIPSRHYDPGAVSLFGSIGQRSQPR